MNEEPSPVDPIHAHDERADVGDLLDDPTDERLQPVVAELRRLYLVAPAAAVEEQHLARMIAVRETSAAAVVAPLGRIRRRRAAVAGAIVAATMAGSIGLAAAGVLPGPLQNAAAAAVRPLGLQLHTTDPEAPPAGSQPAATTTVPGTGNGTGSAADDAPGRGGENPGQSADSPGQATDPGRSQDAPGHGEDNPGRSDEAPGHTGEAPGKSAEAPGHGGDKPGNPGGVTSSVAPPSTKPPVVPPSTARPTPPTSVTPPTTVKVPPSTEPGKKPEKGPERP